MALVRIKDKRLTTRRRVLAGVGAAAVCGWVSSAAAEEMADMVLVQKSARTLSLLRLNRELGRFRIELGSHPVGPKLEKGDGRTPEGLYSIDARSAQSSYHRSLHISYPNDADLARAHRAGVDPGGNIAIHGMPNDYGPFDPVGYFKDWTDGCIAVGNLAIDKIWDRVEVGVPVEIRP